MSDFDFDMDFSDDDIDRDSKGGGVTLAEGSYCLQCTSIEPHTDPTGNMKVVLEVLSGTVPSEIGKSHFEFISYPEPGLSDEANGVRRSIIRRLFYALRLTTPEEIKANPKVKIDLGLAVGRTCCGKAAHETFVSKKSGEKETKAKFFAKGGDLFASDSPKAAGIPMPETAEGGAASGAKTNGPAQDDLDAMLG